MSAENSLSPLQLAADILEAQKHYDVIRSTPRTLLLDLDNQEAKDQYERVISTVKAEFGVIGVVSWASKSFTHAHVLITLKEDLPLSVRIALQAALGSDGVREALGVKRMLNGCVEPCLLFRPWGTVIVTEPSFKRC